jgi:hypothetical protein
VLASGSRQVWELLESDTARGEKTNGRRAGARDKANPRGRGRWRRPRGARRETDSREVDAEAAAVEARCVALKILQGEVAAPIAITVDGGAPVMARPWRGIRSEERDMSDSEGCSLVWLCKFN